jgi:uncharacterized protein YdeI (YjbR/CyaY-like superfamily)
MDTVETLTVISRQEWRDWLAAHHQDKPEIWLALNRDPSARQGLTLGQAQEEALCFGWMDSTLKSLSEASYLMRFSPRPRHSRWGRSNRARALKMLRLSKMTPAGMALLPPEVLRLWENEKPPEQASGEEAS